MQINSDSEFPFSVEVNGLELSENIHVEGASGGCYVNVQYITTIIIISIHTYLFSLPSSPINDSSTLPTRALSLSIEMPISLSDEPIISSSLSSDGTIILLGGNVSFVCL